MPRWLGMRSVRLPGPVEPPLDILGFALQNVNEALLAADRELAVVR